MKFNWNRAGIVILTLLLALWGASGSAQAQTAPDNSSGPLSAALADFAAGEVIVALHAELSGEAATDDAISAASNTLIIGSQQFTTLQSLDMRVAFSDVELRAADSHAASGVAEDTALSGWLVQVEPGAEMATIDLLNRDPAVAFAEPNWIVRAADSVTQEEPLGTAASIVGSEVSNGTLPPFDADLIAVTPLAQAETPFFVSDPFYAEEQWDMQRIGASRAWQLLDGTAAQTAAQPMRIAVIDSGIDRAHGDLFGRVLPGKNYLDPDESAYDDYGHGTHVAGSAGAALNNGVGIAGVASNVRLEPRKVLDGNGAGRISNLAQAIRDAADDGAQIINLSLETGEENRTLSLALEYAAQQGVLLIAASGNGGREVKWPAAHPDVMAIGALDYNDQRAYYSNFGEEIELAAPGGTATWPIYSTWSQDAVYINPITGRETNKCDTGLLVVSNNAYCARTGTSMAAGIVSGVAAAVWTQQPELTADEVRELLQESATGLDADPTYVGGGRVNMYAALREVVPAQLQLSTPVLDYKLPEVTAPFTATVELRNDSAQPLDWEATLALNSGDNASEDVEAAATNAAWLGTGSKLSGKISYGQPARIALQIVPTSLPTGNSTHSAMLTITGTRADGTIISREAEIALTISEPLSNVETTVFLPFVEAAGSVRIAENDLVSAADAAPMRNVEYRWEKPDESGRIIHSLTDGSSESLDLPFEFEMRGRSYDSARLFSDGMLTFPDEGHVNTPPRCLPNVERPRQGIYGWWADLDPSDRGARVSSFTVSEDRFVIEFENVPDAAETYRVSFQIVLNRGGPVGLNYGELVGTSNPDALIASAGNASDNRAAVVVGVEGMDGRFYNLVSCTSNSLELGSLPRPFQSILFSPGDIY